MITDTEVYFAKGCGRCARFETPDCSVAQWREGLLALRDLCRASGMEEVAKWGHPVFMHAGRNIVVMGAFRQDFRLSFFNAGLMKDPDGALEKQGPNTQHPDALRFQAVAQVAAKADTIRRYLAEAMGYAEAGLRQDRAQSALDLPVELLDALDADPALAESFAALTPGRQKSYVLHLAQAKTSATREARIARCRDKILAGKGFNDY